MTDALYYILTNDADVAFQVGTRIYPSRIPLNTAYPAVTFQVISDVPDQVKTGRSNYYNGRVQINCFAVNATAYSGYQRSIDLATAVKDALYRITPGTYAGQVIKSITLLSELDLTDDNSDYEGVFYRVLDFNICHEG